MQDGLDFRNDAFAAFGSYQDPEVRDTGPFHPVEFPAQAVAVRIGAFGGQQGSVPEICPHEIGGGVGDDESGVFDAGEFGRVRSGGATAEAEQRQGGECGQTVHNAD